MTQIKGIDVSKFQGTIDWKKVDASGIDFVLIRAGYGNELSQKDPMFDRNVRGALARGLHVGAYWFSYAVSVQDAVNESKVFKQVLAPYRGKIDFPVGFDYEYDSVTYAQKHGVNPSNTLIDSMARAFLDAMRTDGWFVNLYTNSDFIRSGKFSAATVAKYDVWLADYAGAPDYLCSIQQTGSAGVVPGITGAVDTDVCSKDYSTIIRAGGYNGYSKPKAPVFKCDTTTDVTLARGQAYQFKVTSKVEQTVSVGTQGVVTLRQKRKVGSDTYYSIVGIGKSGTAAGVYVGGVKQFIAHRK